MILDLGFGIFSQKLHIARGNFMKNYTIILITLSAFFIAACQTTEQANQPQNAVNAANETNKAVVETKTAEPAVSPTDTLKALNEAGKKKDLAELKKHFSQASFDLFEKEARAQNKTIDEFLSEREYDELPEIQNEKIEGDRATVEIKDSKSGVVEQIPLVKENGQWKVAFDLYLENLEAQLEEAQKPESNK